MRCWTDPGRYRVAVPSDPATPFVLGGSPRWRPSALRPIDWTALGTLFATILLPLRGLFLGTGASMEEGFMLVFPRLVHEGQAPNEDFLHLYGPASLDVLALWFDMFGDSLESERAFGLLQHLAIIAALYALARVSGHVAAAGAGIVASFFVLTPIGLSALAWHGGLALGLWAVVFASRARANGSWGSWWVAGILAGLALGYRPDLVIALALALGWLMWKRTHGFLVVLAGALTGLLPMWWHLARVGIPAAWEGMVVEPVVDLRPGRELPRPPSWGQVDGALQAVAESLPPWWGLPAPSASQQLFVWFWMVIIVAIGVALGAVVAYRRADASTRQWLVPLVAGGLFGLGILPQAMQRPDSTHLAWVAVVSWPLAIALLSPLVTHRLRLIRGNDAAGAITITAVVGLVMLVVCPFFTFRTYVLAGRVSVGNLPAPFEIERDGRRFWVGDPAVATAINDMIPDLESIMEPGDSLIVGPGDLSRTIYADTYVYWLFPELEPGTRYIEMDPGLADAPGSGLAEEIASADFVVLTNTWSGWMEPNASSEHGSQEHNQAVANHHCLVKSYETNLVLLFRACEGGGGFDPATVAGRAGGIGGGGVESAG
jgi:hypothetical protein